MNPNTKWSKPTNISAYRLYGGLISRAKMGTILVQCAISLLSFQPILAFVAEKVPMLPYPTFVVPLLMLMLHLHLHSEVEDALVAIKDDDASTRANWWILTVPVLFALFVIFADIKGAKRFYADGLTDKTYLVKDEKTAETRLSTAEKDAENAKNAIKANYDALLAANTAKLKNSILAAKATKTYDKWDVKTKDLKIQKLQSAESDSIAQITARKNAALSESAAYFFSKKEVLETKIDSLTTARNAKYAQIETQAGAFSWVATLALWVLWATMMYRVAVYRIKCGIHRVREFSQLGGVLEAFWKLIVDFFYIKLHKILNNGQKKLRINSNGQYGVTIETVSDAIKVLEVTAKKDVWTYSTLPESVADEVRNAPCTGVTKATWADALFATQPEFLKNANGSFSILDDERRRVIEYAIQKTLLEMQSVHPSVASAPPPQTVAQPSTTVAQPATADWTVSVTVPQPTIVDSDAKLKLLNDRLQRNGESHFTNPQSVKDTVVRRITIIMQEIQDCIAAASNPIDETIKSKTLVLLRERANYVKQYRSLLSDEVAIAFVEQFTAVIEHITPPQTATA